MYLLDLFEERGDEGAMWFSVCGVPLDDWANGGYVDVLFLFGWVWF